MFDGGILLADHDTGTVYQIFVDGRDLDVQTAPPGLGGAAYSQTFTDTVTGALTRLYMASGALYPVLADTAGSTPAVTLVDPRTGATHLLSFARGALQLDASTTTGWVLFVDRSTANVYRFRLSGGLLDLPLADVAVSVSPVYLTDATGAVLQLVVDEGNLFPIPAPAGTLAPLSIPLTDEATGAVQSLSVLNGDFALP